MIIIALSLVSWATRIEESPSRIPDAHWSKGWISTKIVKDDGLVIGEATWEGDQWRVINWRGAYTIGTYVARAKAENALEWNLCYSGSLALCEVHAEALRK